MLVPAVPRLLRMRSPEALEREIARRESAERELSVANAELEQRVRERTAALEDLARRLAEADRRKTEFLAVLAHELRNPLAPLRTGVELLGSEEAETRAWVRGMMERQMRQLVTIVDDLLDVSRITRGKLELRRRPVELSEVVHAAVEASRPHLDAAGHALAVSLPDESLVLDGDPHRLAQVLSNLLNNAAKYTPPGGHVGLSVRREGGEAVIRVTDDGRGIAAGLLPHVFEIFMQAPGARESDAGLGIGLTLVKALVEMHGGRVGARSEGPGKGSEFEVVLPLSLDGAAPAAAGPAGLREAVPPRVVLVVDDNPDAAESLARLLRAEGHEVHSAHDGEEALAVAAAVQPSVVLMDLGMPRIDGIEAARRLRREAWGKDVMLVAVTGLGQEADRVRTREAGFDRHLVKPAEPETLRSLLAPGDA